MPITKLSFPEFSLEALSELAFASIDSTSLFVVYESHRDFLSAPRQHIVLRLRFAESIAMNSSGEWLSDIHWRQLDEAGIFNVEASEVVLKPGEQHILIVHPDGLLEFCATEIDLASSVYHQPSSKAALLAHLQAL